jgi:hypothetical protein
MPPTRSLLADLLPGNVDIVGDVHGEIDHLETLLDQLGYRDNGVHPADRRLVFVGDLPDRGPDSPAVVRRVSELVEAERAQCVLGNHELNVLRGDAKEENRWITEQRRETYPYGESVEVVADDETVEEVLAFFRTLPLALAPNDLRVVHACWDEGHIEALRRAKESSVVEASESWAEEQREKIESWDGFAQAEEQEATHREALYDLTREEFPMLHALAERRVMEQNEHPVKVLTSGREEVASEPFRAGGRGFAHKGPGIFAEDANPLGPLGQGDVMCVDYAVGHRARERAEGVSERQAFLAAYRWPEREVVFSDCDV